jgi:4-hydroxyphenylpyruvate dioxygenase-like putative hemolysin
MSVDVASAPRWLRVDHVELAVADVDRAADLHHRLGFVRVATRELRERRVRSYRLVSGNLSIVLSESRLATDPIAVAVAKHGDGIFSLGFLCPDALSALERLHQRGAQVLEAPRTVRTGDPVVEQTQAQVLAFGHVRHTLVSRNGGPFLEGFPPMPSTSPAGFGIERVAGWLAFVEPEHFAGAAARYAQMLGLVGVGANADESHRRWTTPDGALFPEMACPTAPGDRAREFLGVSHGAGVGEVTFVASRPEETRARIAAAGLAIDRETGLTEPIAGQLRYRVVGG